MPALNRRTRVIALAITFACLSTPAFAQTGALALPTPTQDPAHPVPWPQTDGSTWVPVFVLGDGDGTFLADPFSPTPVGSVLLGVAQVRGQTQGADTVSVAPALQWRLTEELGLGAAVTVTDFVPCRSLMQTPLAPLRSDACQSYASEGLLGVSGSLSVGDASFTVGYSQSPAIWVLPGSLGPATALGTPTSLPMAPLAGTQREPAQTLTLGGELSLSERSRVGVALAMSRLPRLENSPDLGRVQFSLDYGPFSADMATQLIRRSVEAANPLWAGMDLGVSWRTPWSGILSVGARNLFSRGDPPRLGNSPRAPVDGDDAFSRTPYVRYEQDF
ncbi:MAG: hypothetical protein IT479_01685 [Xanthomonadales bacterium]|nr:hypothetical protein [Xanthomonadales bacterium]MCC6591961.1 hypothetical protein [Xanthomonadales bacterium]MCE7929912.1 hypothetical protein [Xanthomonadales bacterium PRO6]